MTSTQKPTPAAAPAKLAPSTKNQQIIDLLSRESGATLEEMSTLTSWQPHSTRSFMTGLKKNGHVIESDKVEGIRRYRIVLNEGA